MPLLRYSLRVNASVTLSSQALALPALSGLGREIAGHEVRIDDPAAEFILDAWNNALELRRRDEPPGRGVQIDVSDWIRPLRKDDPLLRAIGPATTVIDATAGFGFDGVALAAAGFEVTLIERSWPLSLLILDACDRLDLKSILKTSPLLSPGDAKEILPTVRSPDIIYMDPMFPPKRRSSARASKRIELLKELVGPDTDSQELLDIACSRALRRVVVKRSDDGPPLTVRGRAPNGSIRGRTVRFDLYAPFTDPSDE